MASSVLQPSNELEVELTCLYERNAAALLRYALLLATDREAARDAVQEVFLRYFIARSEGQRFENSRAWLFRVLRNHLLDALRSGRSKNEIGIEDAHNSADASQDPEATYHRAEISKCLSSSLAPRELEYVRLRAEGLRYQEIADVLDVRCGTVAGTLARAHAKIRQSLRRAGYIPEEGRKPMALLVAEETPHAS